jgi:hypothetical protein
MASDLVLHRNNFVIFTACKQSKWKKAIKALKSLRFTPNYKPPKEWSQWSALHLAAASSTPAFDACQILLTSGFSPTCPARTGETPLDLAQQRGHENIIELLEFYSKIRISLRQNSVEKKLRRMATKDASFVVPKAVHLIPVPLPDLQPDPEEGFQSFDQLVDKFKNICPNFKFPQSKYLP